MLIEQYYQYASSNVIDETIQRLYYQKAYDLLLPIMRKDNKNASLWMRLAHLFHHLGDLTKALYAACRVLQLQPSSAEAYQLALDLAFRTHAWDTLGALTKRGQPIIPRVSKMHSALQCWTALHPEGHGGTIHG